MKEGGQTREGRGNMSPWTIGRNAPIRTNSEKWAVSNEVDSIGTEHLALIYINKSVHILPIWDTMVESWCSKIKSPFSFLLHHVDVAIFLFMRYMAAISLFHFLPGSVLIFTSFLFWKCFHFTLVQSLSIQNSILNDPNKSKPKQGAEPFNFAMPSEHGLKEHIAGFSGEWELGLWGTVLGRRFSGLLVVSPWSASWDRPFVPIWLP